MSEHSSEFGGSGIRKGALRRARIAFARADLVCPVSEYLRSQLEDHGVRARFQVAPNAVDTGLFRPSEGARADGPTRMITVASLDPKKGIDHLLNALGVLSAERRDFALDVVGDGPRREEYEQLARRLGVEDLVVFHGASPKADVVRLMRRADALVLPSLTENLPLAIIEAMACGLPVIASRVGGIPEMVDDQTRSAGPAGRRRGTGERRQQNARPLRRLLERADRRAGAEPLVTLGGGRDVERALPRRALGAGEALTQRGGVRRSLSTHAAAATRRARTSRAACPTRPRSGIRRFASSSSRARSRCNFAGR